MLLVAWLNIDLLIMMNLDLPQVFLAAKMLKAEHFSRSCLALRLAVKQCCPSLATDSQTPRNTQLMSIPSPRNNNCLFLPSKNSHNAARQEANLNWSQKCTTAQMRILGIVKNRNFYFFTDFSVLVQCDSHFYSYHTTIKKPKMWKKWRMYKSRNMNRPLRRSFPPIGVLPSIFSYEVWRARHNIWAVIIRTRTSPIGRAPKSWNS